MTILLFTLSVILAMRMVYLYATDEYDKILKDILLRRKNPLIVDFFTFLEILFVILALVLGENDTRFVIYIYLTHNILFALMVSVEKMLFEKQWKNLFLIINFIIFTAVTINYGYAIWTETL